MAKVIIGIHGLGNKPAGNLLEKWWRASINEGLVKLGQPIPDLNFKLIYWADVFYDRPLNENIVDKEDPLYLEERYTPAPMDDIFEEHPVRQKILDVLEKELDSIFLNEDMTINFSSIADAIIHRYFKELDFYYSKDISDTSFNSMEAKNIIHNRVVNEFQKHQGDDILLIGHSMGSIIAYDVINYIAPDIDIHTLVTLGSPLGFPVIMGKIAAERNISLPKLHKLKTPESVKRKWYNLSDLEDKIALIYRLSGNFDPNSSGVHVTDMIIHNNYQINGERNPHKSFGYLRTPEMARILYDFQVNDRMKDILKVKKGWKKLRSFFRKKLIKK